MPTIQTRRKANGDLVFKCLARTWNNGEQVNMTRTFASCDDAKLWGEEIEKQMRKEKKLAELKAMGFDLPERHAAARKITIDLLKSGKSGLDKGSFSEVVKRGIELIGNIASFNILTKKELVSYFSKRHNEGANFFEVNIEAGLLKLYLNLSTGSLIHHGGNLVELAMNQVIEEKGLFKAEHIIEPDPLPGPEVVKEESLEGKVVRLSNEGLTLRMIAEQLGIGKSTVSRMLK